MHLISRFNMFFLASLCLMGPLGCDHSSNLFNQGDGGDNPFGSADTNPESDTNSGSDDTSAFYDTSAYDTSASLEDWEMYLTVDNMFDVYFGSPTHTTGQVVGRGDNWRKEYYYEAKNRLATDYMYVATASDHLVAQGFLGTFTNLTLGKTTDTGDAVWQVFPAGAYKETNPDHWPNPWPPSTMPTQAEVDRAIAYATANDLWVTPVSPPGYDNDPTTSIAPATSEWRTHCNPVCTYDHIPTTARWIWHDSGRGGSTSWANPLAQFNHDEFLVFRVAGAVEEVVY